MKEFTSLIAIALVFLLPQVASASTIYTLPDDYTVLDSGAYGGNAYAAGRIGAGTGATGFLFNLTTSSQIDISVPQYNGVDARTASITAVDWSTGTAWVDISYGPGIANRTGSVSITGGEVTLNQFQTTGTSSSTAVNAAAGGYGFGQSSAGPVATQPGGFWSAMTDLGGAIWDAVTTAVGNSIAVGGVGNVEGGSNAAVFTNLTLTLQHDCGTSLCSLQSVSSDGLWGGLTFDNQIGLLDLTTNERYLLGEGTVSGILGGPSKLSRRFC